MEASAINKNPLFKTAQLTQIGTDSNNHPPRTREIKTLKVKATRNENRPTRKPLGKGQQNIISIAMNLLKANNILS